MIIKCINTNACLSLESNRYNRLSKIVPVMLNILQIIISMIYQKFLGIYLIKYISLRMRIKLD